MSAVLPSLGSGRLFDIFSFKCNSRTFGNVYLLGRVICHSWRICYARVLPLMIFIVLGYHHFANACCCIHVCVAISVTLQCAPRTGHHIVKYLHRLYPSHQHLASLVDHFAILHSCTCHTNGVGTRVSPPHSHIYLHAPPHARPNEQRL